MKRIYSFIAFIAAVAMFTACGSDDASYNAVPTLEVTSADVLFEAEGGDGSIVLNTANTVAAATDANWLTLTVNGNKVVVTANPNLSREGRNAVIKLHAGNTETQVTATQKSSIYGVPSQEFEIADYEASIDIPVTHTQDVTVQSNTDWITATWNPETNKIEIEAEDNNEADPREGTITITMGEYSDEITIVQHGFLLELEEEEVETTDDAGNVSVSVNHSRVIEKVESQADWIKASFNNKTNALVCKVTANDTGWERTGTVTITSGPVTRTLTITQFDYTKDVLGEFEFVYASDAMGSQWSSIPAELTSDELILHVTKTVDFTIPVEHDTKSRIVFAGPSNSFVGDFLTYYIRLHFGFIYENNIYSTSILSTQDYYSYGEFDTYEYKDGSISVLAQFAGSIISDNDMFAWEFYPYKDAEATVPSTKAIMSVYYPSLERVIYEPDQGAKAHKAKSRNTTAPLGSKQNPIPAFDMPLVLQK